jgi:hypothetical protein
MTIKDFKKQRMDHLKETHPNIPDHALPSKNYSDKTANGLTTLIKDFCDVNGVMCVRSGNEGRYRPGKNVVDVIGRTRVGKGTWLPGQNNGMADLQITIKGRIHYVEVKVGKDRQSDVQKDFEDKAKRAGASYDIVKEWSDFYKLYAKWVSSK